MHSTIQTVIVLYCMLLLYVLHSAPAPALAPNPVIASSKQSLQPSKSTKNKSSNSTIIVRSKNYKKNSNQNIPIDYIHGKTSYKNTLAQILEEESHISSIRIGGYGSYSSVSILGSAFNQTGIYINKVLLNNTYSGLINIEDIPLFFISSINIHTGEVPFYLSSSHIGGTIELQSNLLSKNPQLLFSFSLHSLLGFRTSALLSTKNQAHHVQLDASYNRYQYKNHAGTIFANTNDDKSQIRKNEEYIAGHYNGFFQKQGKKFIFNAFISYLGKRRNIPGPIPSEWEKVHSIGQRGIVSLDYKHIISKKLYWNVYTNLYLLFSDLRDPKNELRFITENTRILGQVEVGFGFHWYIIPKKWKFFALFRNIIDQIYIFTNTNKPFRNQSELVGYSIFEPYNWLYIKGTIKAVLVYNRQNNFITRFSGTVNKNDVFAFPSASMQVGLYPIAIIQRISNVSKSSPHNSQLYKDYFLLYQNFSYQERTPSFSENYGDGQYILPNLNLQNERGFSYTLGIQNTIPFRNIMLEINTYYVYKKSYNLLITLFESNGFSRIENLGAGLIHTFNVKYKIRWKKYLTHTAQFTYLNTKDEGESRSYYAKQFPYYPKYKASISLEFGWGRWYLLASFNLQWHIYRDRINTNTTFYYLPYIIICNIAQKIYLDKANKYIFIFKIHNVFNQKYNLVINYPLPGRYFEITLRIKIDWNKDAE